MWEPVSPGGGLKFYCVKQKFQLQFHMLYCGQKVNTPRYVIELARELRRNLTESEQLLWTKLRNRQLHGYRFRCQHPLYRYILDFYCHKALLAVEIDGPVHNYQIGYDTYRDEFIKSIGISTIRFSIDEVFDSIEDVINQIRDALLKQNF